jgi:hypothetical protein
MTGNIGKLINLNSINKMTSVESAEKVAIAVSDVKVEEKVTVAVNTVSVSDIKLDNLDQDILDATIDDSLAELTEAAELAAMKHVKVTQKLIDAGYRELLKVIQASEEKDSEHLGLTSAALFSQFAMQISDKLMGAASKKEYRVELALAIVRKLVNSKVESAVERSALHDVIETSIPLAISILSVIPAWKKLFNACGCSIK